MSVTFPIDSNYDYKINSIYGWRDDPVNPGTQQYHSGVDIVAKAGSINGSQVLSMQSGTVIYSGTAAGYGNVVVIRNTDGTSFLYAHMQDGSTNNIHKGETITQGSQIGLVGSTGTRSTGPHLHIEYLTSEASDKIYKNISTTGLGIDGDSKLPASATPQRMNPIDILNSAKQGVSVGYVINNETGLSDRDFISHFVQTDLYKDILPSKTYNYNGTNYANPTYDFAMEIITGEKSTTYKAYDTNAFDDAWKSFGFSSTSSGWSYTGADNAYLDNQTTTTTSGDKVTVIGSNDKVSLQNTGTGTSGGSFISGIASWIKDSILTKLNFASTLESPLVLDLDGDGVELIHADNGVYFDIDNDGFGEQVGWVKSDDGMLAMDRNNNGIIDNITELYGDDKMPAFDKLRLEDSNKDGVINASDTNYSKLLVWRDLDKDGQTDTGELKTLFETGITSISLSTQTENRWLQENFISAKSTFVMNGTTREIDDVHFLNNNNNSRFVGYGQVQKVIEINPETLLMPLSRGYGTMASMHIALDKDQVLMQMMKDFVNLPAANSNEIYTRVQDILYQWAGVKNVDPAKYATGEGNFIDGRKVAFMDAFFGQPFMQRGQNDLIGIEASQNLNNAWEDLMGQMTIRFLVQGPFAGIFNNAKYDFQKDQLTLNDNLTNIISKAQTYAAGLGSGTDNSYFFWTQLGHALVLSKTEIGATTDQIRSKLTQAAGTSIYVTDGAYALKADGSNNVIKGLDGGDHIYALGGNDTVYGNKGDDYIEGGTGHDTIYGSLGRDRIYGGDGNDIIYGDDGDDQLSGEYGQDKVSGGKGNDYITMVLYKPYNLNLEYDTIDGGEGVDTLNLWGGSDHVSGWYTGVYADMRTGSTGLLINGSASYVTKTFSNIENLSGSSRDDIFYGDAGDNSLNGEDGNDILYGGDGDDQLFGNDGAWSKLYGEGGNDYLEVSPGNDYMDGGAGIDWVSYAHPYIVTAVTVNLITGKSSGAADAQNVSWANGDTIINIENVKGTNYNDNITGNSQDNTIWGLEGSDTIYGNSGNDSLWGGSGDDFIYGEDGNDSIFAGQDNGNDFVDGGNGDDIIYGYSGNDKLYGGTGNDTIDGGAGADVIDGGSGNDTLSYTTSNAGVEINLMTGQGKLGHAEGDTFVNFENFIGSSYSDKFTIGNATLPSGNILDGGAGTDTAVFDGNLADYKVTLDGTKYLVTRKSDNASYTLPNVEKLTFNDKTISYSDFPGSGDALISKRPYSSAQGVIMPESKLNTVNISLLGNANNHTVTLNSDGTFTLARNNVISGQDSSSLTSSIYTGIDQFKIKLEDSITGLTRIETIKVENGSEEAPSISHVVRDLYSTTGQKYPSVSNITKLNNGDLFLSWESIDYFSNGSANLYTLKGQRYSATGGKISNEITLSDTVSTNISRQKVVELKNGNLAIIYDHNPQGAYFKIIDANGSVIKSSIFSGDGYILAPDVVALDDGGFAVSFTASFASGLGYDVLQKFDASGNKISTQNLPIGINNNGIYAYHTNLSKFSNGDVLVSGGSNVTGVQSIIIKSNGDKSSVLNLQKQEEIINIGLYETFYDVKVLSDKLFALVYRPTGSDIKVKIFDTSGKLAYPEAIINIANNSNVYHLNITPVNGKYFLVTWQDNAVVQNTATTFTDTQYNSQIFDFSGNKIGEQFIVNNYNQGRDTYAPAIVSLSDNNVGFFWIDNYGDMLSKVFSITHGKGTSGNDVLQGDDSNNTLIGYAGADIIDGSYGTDTLSYADSTAGVNVNLSITSGFGTTANTGLITTQPIGYIIPVGNIIQSGGTVTILPYPYIGTNNNNQYATGKGGDAEGDRIANIENLIGSSKDDTLTGNALANRIEGGGGNDTINGAGGDDVLVSGLGRDIITLDVAANTKDTVTDFDIANDKIDLTAFNFMLHNFEDLVLIMSQVGSDTVINFGNGQTLTLQNVTANTLTKSNFLGDISPNIINGTTANNTITGTTQKDIIYADAGDDTITTGIGADIIDGGAGADTVSYKDSASAVTVNLITGVNTGGTAEGDTLISIERISGSDYNDILTGDANSNYLYGNGGNDTLNGDAGNDYLQGSAGADILNGGAGTDIARYDGETVGVNVNLTTGIGTGGNAEGDAYISIENVWGSNAADTITGDANANNLIGNGGDDTLYGLVGNDALEGRDGNDQLFGGDGDDSLLGGIGADMLDGGAGSDVAAYWDSTASVNVSLLTNVGIGGYAEGDILTNIERLSGSNYNDTLTGNAGNNNISGGNGNDIISGDAGDDYIDGGVGGDIINGGIGTDASEYASSTAAINIDLTAGTASGGYAEGDVLTNIENIYGSAYNDTIRGNSANNNLQGKAGNDIIDGLDGNDSISGGDGDDILHGNIGNDSISGNNGNDSLYGDEGDDTLNGGAGADILDGGAGTADTASYSDSTAAVTVSLLTNTGLGGYAESDTLIGIERLSGSAYNDTLTGDANNNYLYGNGGNDIVNGDAGNDNLYGGNGLDTLSGGVGNDSLYGEADNDNLSGGDGDDTLYGGAGADTIDGGAGYDTVSYTDSTLAVNINLATGVNTGGYAEGETLANIERIWGSAYNDVMTGSSGNDNFAGNKGNDIFYGAAGNDGLYGEDGNDTIYGESGNDILQGGNGDDALYGGEGDDQLFGGAGIDLLDGGAGTADIATYTDSTAAVTVSLLTNTGTGGYAEGDTLVGIERLSGSAYNDILTGDANANILYGNAGNDIVNGDAGNDTLYGSTGLDTLSGGIGNDTLYGEADNDNLSGGDGDDTLMGGLGADVLDGGAGIYDVATYTDSTTAVIVNLTTGTGTGGYAEGDTLTGIERLWGSSYADTLTGDAVNNTIIGNAGEDKLYGLAGNDTLEGRDGNDQLFGGDGDDSLLGGTGADILDGGAGTADNTSYTDSTAAVTVSLITGTGTGGYAEGDTLINIERLSGSAYADILTGDINANYLYGNNGNDNLSGGDGNDTLYGGNDNDTVNGDAGNDNLYGGNGLDTLSGGIGNDYLYGEADNDSLSGGDGDDSLQGGLGADILDGGLGNDTASYSDSTAAVTINLLTNTVAGGYADGDTLISIERLAGSAYNDTITGNASANILYGNGGNDTMYGDAGDDQLYGGAGADIMDGGIGSDIAYYTDSTVAVNVNLATGINTGGYAEGDIFTSIERVYGSNYNDILTGSSQNDRLEGYAGDDYIDGGDGNDILVVWGGNDIVKGGAGDDYIESGIGNNNMDGGTGNDAVDYWNSNAAINIDLTAGNASGGYAQGDTLVNIENIYGSAFNDTIRGNTANNNLQGRAGVDTIYGMDGNDTISGGDGNDLVDGGNGNDTMSGDAGDDTMYGGDGDDAVWAQAGNDKMYGGTGNDRMGGNDGNDIIYGESGNDTIWGDAGNDIIHGGLGADILTGSFGSDNFNYDNILDSTGGSFDTINDFTIGQDHIDLTMLNTFGIDSFTDLTFSQNAAHTETIITANDTAHPGAVDHFELHLKGIMELHQADFVWS